MTTRVYCALDSDTLERLDTAAAADKRSRSNMLAVLVGRALANGAPVGVVDRGGHVSPNDYCSCPSSCALHGV
ncbi:hypothetical protein LCGC14_1369900 [marine sediment metagenome]|uniref:CopG-like ribbon-helix-helix domain-containing protein n=1 Tax=marine sediment metagenome TaxID=412755 RepID=A0A0F9KRK4_9ZZZZ